MWRLDCSLIRQEIPRMRRSRRKLPGRGPVKIIPITLAAFLFCSSHAPAQDSNCGIVSYSNPSTPDYVQGGAPSGFNLGDLRDDAGPDMPEVVIPAPSSANTSIAYGSCVHAETIDDATSNYDADDPGRPHRSATGAASVSAGRPEDATE